MAPESEYKPKPTNEQLTPIEGDFVGKDILSMSQFDRKSIEKLLIVASDMEISLKRREVPSLLSGIGVAAIFDEPSTRTNFAFQSAAIHLRAHILSSDAPGTFPKIEDERFDHKIQAYKSAAREGVIVLRHPQIGAAAAASKAVRLTEGTVPVINAGDGSGEHPTQTLTDLFTLKKRFGKLNNLNGVIAGDLKNGRTVHSLIKGLALFGGNQITLLSPNELKVPEQDKPAGITIRESNSEKDIPNNADFWYWTRVQKERFINVDEYENLAHSQVLTKDLIKKHGNENMVIMHPGPVIDEVDDEVRHWEYRFIYFEQAANKLPVYMALLALITGKIN